MLLCGVQEVAAVLDFFNLVNLQFILTLLCDCLKLVTNPV